MLAHLRKCEDRSKLFRLLPANIKAAHKGGSVSATRCDAGIIYSPEGPLAICVLTTRNETDVGAAKIRQNFSVPKLPKKPTTTLTQTKGPIRKKVLPL